MWLLAETSPTEYGALGLVIASLTSAVTWLAKTAINREAERADRAERELSQAQNRFAELLTEKAIPALVESARTMQDTQLLIQRMYDRMERQTKL